MESCNLKLFQRKQKRPSPMVENSRFECILLDFLQSIMFSPPFNEQYTSIEGESPEEDYFELGFSKLEYSYYLFF